MKTLSAISLLLLATSTNLSQMGNSLVNAQQIDTAITSDISELVIQDDLARLRKLADAKSTTTK